MRWRQLLNYEFQVVNPKSAFHFFYGHYHKLVHCFTYDEGYVPFATIIACFFARSNQSAIWEVFLYVGFVRISFCHDLVSLLPTLNIPFVYFASYFTKFYLPWPTLWSTCYRPKFCWRLCCSVFSFLCCVCLPVCIVVFIWLFLPCLCLCHSYF